MAKIALFFGTTTGNTEEAAEAIQTAFGGDSVVELFEIHSAENSDFESHNNIIVGCPTWNIGELQDDWESFFPDLDDIDFSGKKVAYFGQGDQIGYGDNFQDAMGILEEKISERGGTTVGLTSTEGYEHDESRAVRGDQFVGLALDEVNQSDQTDSRIASWVTQLRSEFGI